MLFALGAAQPVIGGMPALAMVAAGVALSLEYWLRTFVAPETKDAVVLVVLLYIVGLVPGVGLWPSGPAIAIAITAA